MASYEIQFTDDEDRRRLYGPLPSEIIDQIETGLRALQDDPWGLSHIPESTFVRIGRHFTVKCKYKNGIYVVYFYLQIDDEDKVIVVRRCKMLPRYTPPSD